MSNRNQSRIRLNKKDKWRVVLTDTSPFEVPIIVSNDGFYKNLHELPKKSEKFRMLISILVVENEDKNFTIPLRYNIVKNSKSIRTLSLLHPRGQVSLSKFYEKYEELICEYSSRSPFSIRAPKKIGGSFFVPSSAADKNRYKNAVVDTTGLDRLVRNPASYFAYSGFSRLYQFFEADDHIRLEKKFRYQLSLDISKCFDSIYTHSIAWAAKSKGEAKESAFSLSFGNQFDRVMQRLNHNETSGICIGPEASRIFAEIILAKIDQDALNQLQKNGIRNKEHYECRRYVDNYYVFANSVENAELVEHELALSLRDYNLHLNEGKRELDRRPFYSQKSLVVDQINKSLRTHWDQLFEAHFLPDGGKAFSPKRIYRYRSLFGKFTREIKAACYASEQGYDAVANYVIGAVKRQAIKLADDHAKLLILDESPVVELHYRQMFHFLLDVGFYFFTLHPTVASSLRLSHALVRVAQHLKAHDPEGLEIIKEAALRWTSLLARSPSFEGLYSKSAVVPIEILNILICLQQFGGDGELEHELISLTKIDGNKGGYFELIVKLFIYGARVNFEPQRTMIWKLVCERIASTKHISKDSEAVHLLLDVLACPHIEVSKRSRLLKDVWVSLSKSTNMGQLSTADAQFLVAEIERQHWFVKWDGVDLLNMIEKKELSNVYA